MRSRKIVKAVNLGSPLKAQIVKEVPQHSRQQEAKESVNEFGKAKMKSLPENDVYFRRFFNSFQIRIFTYILIVTGPEL